MGNLKFMTMFLVFLIVSCDMPRPSKRRLEDTSNFSTVNFDNTPTNTSGTTTGSSNNNSGETTSEGGTSETLSNVDIPSDATHCTWSTNGTDNYRYSHTIVGKYNLCRSQNSNNTVYLQLQNAVASGARLCFIPVTRIGIGDDTTYIGNPHCGYFYESHKIYNLSFTITRTSQSNQSPHIDGFIIVKDESAAYPAPYPLMTPYGYPQAGQGASMYHHQAYYSCIDALEIYRTTAYCQAFESVGQFVNHVPL